MAVKIVGMEMPKSCRDCVFNTYTCFLTQRDIKMYAHAGIRRSPYCPLHAGWSWPETTPN